MSERVSCISHVPSTPVVVLHSDYLGICDNHIGAAIILKIMEHWTNTKIDHKEQNDIENEARKKDGKPEEDSNLWVYKTTNGFIKDALGILKEHDVVNGLKILISKGYLERRTNPKYKWDRTLQYKLNIKLVQSALSIPHQCDMDTPPILDRKDTYEEAIPELTTKLTTKLNSKTTLRVPENEEPPHTLEDGTVLQSPKGDRGSAPKSITGKKGYSRDKEKIYPKSETHKLILGRYNRGFFANQTQLDIVNKCMEKYGDQRVLDYFKYASGSEWPWARAITNMEKSMENYGTKRPSNGYSKPQERKLTFEEESAMSELMIARSRGFETIAEYEAYMAKFEKKKV